MPNYQLDPRQPVQPSEFFMIFLKVQLNTIQIQIILKGSFAPSFPLTEASASTHLRPSSSPPVISSAHLRLSTPLLVSPSCLLQSSSPLVFASQRHCSSPPLSAAARLLLSTPPVVSLSQCHRSSSLNSAANRLCLSYVCFIMFFFVNII